MAQASAFDSDDTPQPVHPPERLAPVVSLTARLQDPAGKTEAVEEVPADVRATMEHWRKALAGAGLDFTTPRPPAEVMMAIADGLERVVGGLLYVRHGGGPHELPPNPTAGMDVDSARHWVSILRGMAAAADTALRSQRQP